jgi:hypothetical protein
MTTKAKYSAAPAINSGDAIELTPLLGKAIAVRCFGRESVETKFGSRQMTQCAVLVEGEAEALKGVLFQSYFQRLPLNEWFVGVVTKMNRSWGLDAVAVTKSQLAKITKLIDAQPDDSDIPF